MSIEHDLLKYVALYEEPDGSYQVDQDDPGEFIPFPYREGTLQAAGAGAMHDPMLGKMRKDGHSKKVHGLKSCAVNFGAPLHSHGIDLSGIPSPPTVDDWALLRLMRAIMGGAIAAGTEAATTQVQAGSTATSIVLTAGHGDRFTPGQPIGLITDSGSPLLEVGVVASVAGDTVTLRQALSAAPVEGSAVRGGVTCYPTEDPSTSIQVLVESREATDGTRFRGLQSTGGPQLELPVGGEGVISFALQGASWDPIGASEVTIPVYTNVKPIICKPLRVCLPLAGATTRVELDVDAISLTLNFAYAPQKSGRAKETIARMVRQPQRPVAMAEITIPWEDNTWHDEWQSPTAIDRAMHLWAGGLPGNLFFVQCPTVQVTNVERVPLSNGTLGQKLRVEARNDEVNNGPDDDFGNAAVRVSWL